MVSLPLLSTVIELTVISVVCDGSKIANQQRVEACPDPRSAYKLLSWRLAPSWRSNNKCYVFRSVCSVIKVTTTTNT